MFINKIISLVKINETQNIDKAIEEKQQKLKELEEYITEHIDSLCRFIQDGDRDFERTALFIAVQYENIEAIILIFNKLKELDLINKQKGINDDLLNKQLSTAKKLAGSMNRQDIVEILKEDIPSF